MLFSDRSLWHSDMVSAGFQWAELHYAWFSGYLRFGLS